MPEAGVAAILKQSRERVDRYLDQRLPAEAEPPESLHGAMRYAVFSGGKRLRPALAFGAALACGADPDRVLPVAGAVELVHAYSLVHDDLPSMDDDEERRGRPTVHVRYGEATAILVGDALLTEAFGLLAAEAAPVDLIERLARAASSRGLVGGQVDDLALSDRALQGAAPSLEEVTSVHARKTAELFSGSRPGEARGSATRRAAPPRPSTASAASTALPFSSRTTSRTAARRRAVHSPSSRPRRPGTARGHTWRGPWAHSRSSAAAASRCGRWPKASAAG
jgi:hypothetical protein